MPYGRKPNRQRVKIHRSYTVDEAARALGVCKPTVRRWIKGGGLAVLTDQKPMLILGADLVDFLKASRAPHQKCQSYECYCVKCRKPQRPACDMIEYIPLTPTSGNLRGLCPECETFMHKRINIAALTTLGVILEVTIAQVPPHLRDRDDPSPNVYL
jgi:excisionase family DNA binding protein